MALNRLWRGVALLVSLHAAMAICFAAPATSPEDTESPSPAPTRQQSIRQALAVIDAQLEAHGGSWESWAEDVRPYRDDIDGFLTDWKRFKWPWPAKRGFVFQGAAIKVHLADSLVDLPKGERPFDAIVHFDRQLKALGIDLIVAIIPSKLSVYPDYIHAAVEGESRPARAPEDRIVALPTIQFMHALLKNDVEVVNLHEAFRQFRRDNADEAALFYTRDSHYLNQGARLSAQLIAERLGRYDFVQQAQSKENPYVAEKGARNDGAKADGDLLVIKDRHGRLYRDRADSPVFVLGDSHHGYNDSRGANFSAQLARIIATPVALKWKEGLSSAIPLELARDRHLDKRRVVIIHYTERALAPSPGRSKWPVVDLPGANARNTPPARTGADGEVRSVRATGVITEVSSPPDRKAAYTHYLMKFHLARLRDGDGNPIGKGEGVVHVLAMHNRKTLPVSLAKKGQSLTLSLTSWDLVSKQYGSLNTGTLPTLELETETDWYWGEVQGQPSLTPEELEQTGEEDSKGAREDPVG